MTRWTGQKGEGPRHEVKIGRAFGVSKTEVTFEQWDAAGGRARPQAVDGWGRGKMPVIDVSWDGSQALCRVAIARNRQGISASDGGRMGICGARRHKHALFVGRRARHRARQLQRLRQHLDPANRPGWIVSAKRIRAARHAGQRLEWVEDVWHDSFEGAPVDGTAWLHGGDASFGVVRGASWHNEPNSPAPPSGSSVTGRFSSTRLGSEWPERFVLSRYSGNGRNLLRQSVAKVFGPGRSFRI